MEEKDFEPQYPAEFYTSRPNPTALLSPLYDSTFKNMFTQETEDSNLALQSFISAVLGRSVNNIKLKPNELPKESTEQKGMSFDVTVEFDDGELSDIEIQAFKQEYDFGIRSEIQAARLLNQNSKKGDNWDSPKVYQISILNFHYRKDDNKELTCYTMKDESGIELSNRLNIIFIDLKTIRKKFGTPVDKLTAVEKWGLFFSFVDKEKNKDYISELVRSEKGIMAAENIVRYMSEADANWFTQNSRYIYERDRNTLIHNAEKRGKAEGLAEGKAEGLVEGRKQAVEEMARSFYGNGVSVEMIARSLGMSEAQVLEIVGAPGDLKE